MKKILSVFAMTLMVCGFMSCSGSKTSDSQAEENKLKECIEMIKTTCPIVINDFMSMDKVEYADKTVTITYGFASNLLDLDAIRANDETFRNNMLIGYASTSDKSVKEMMELIIEADADLCMVFKNKDNDSYTMRFTAEELKANQSDAKADPEKMITVFADNARLQMPMKVDNGMVMTDIILEKGYLTYTYLCDEPEYDMKIFEENKLELKNFLIKELAQQGSFTEELASLLTATNRVLAYKYIGSSSGKTCTIYIKPSEL